MTYEEALNLREFAKKNKVDLVLSHNSRIKYYDNTRAWDNENGNEQMEYEDNEVIMQMITSYDYETVLANTKLLLESLKEWHSALNRGEPLYLADEETLLMEKLEGGTIETIHSLGVWEWKLNDKGMFEPIRKLLKYEIDEMVRKEVIKRLKDRNLFKGEE